MHKKKRRSGPTVAEQSVTDTEATALVKGWFARGWLLRDRLPRDIYIDYEIERVESAEPSGITFYGQQKAHRVVNFSDGLAGQPFDTKDLRYYAQKQDRPVFLLLVDVTAKRGWYLFLQEWLDVNTTHEKLAKQGSVTVKVPNENCIDDLPRLVTAVTRSVAYMREKYPGSVAAALRGDIKRAQALYPGADVTLDVIDSKKRYKITPQVPLKLHIEATGEPALRFRELLDYGRPIDITGEGISVSGLPTMPGVATTKIARLALRPANEKDFDFELWLEGPGEEFRVRLEGVVTQGTAGFYYRGELKNAPLQVEIKVDTAVVDQRGHATMTVSWDFSKWEGRSVLDLPYFDALSALTEASLGSRRICHRFAYEGRRINGGTLGAPNQKAPFVAAAQFLSLLKKARSLSREFHARLVLPPINSLSERDEADLAFAHAVAFEGGFRTSHSDITLQTSANIQPEQLRTFVSQSEPLGFCAIQPTYMAKVLGVEIDVGPVEIRLNPAVVRLPGGQDTLPSADAEGLIPIEIHGKGEATVCIRRLTEKEREEFYPSDAAPQNPAGR